jgi:hypothetical protein
MRPSTNPSYLRPLVALALIAAIAATLVYWPRRFQWLADGIIVPPCYASQFDNRNADSYWQPSRADVAIVARGIPAYVRSREGHACCLRAGRWRQLDQYVHIYIGVVEHGRKLIAVQLQHLSNYESVDVLWGRPRFITESWTTPISMCDGGDSRIFMSYDVASGTFTDLQTGGE